MVDIHSHILPEVDDGARSWEMALHMCQMAAADGIDHIVATPHANDDYAYDRPWLSSVLEQLQQRVGASPRLSLGCDFHFSYDNLKALEDEPGRFTIGRTSYLLIELSDFAIPNSVGDKIVSLIEGGLKPILTHPERNAILQRSPGKVLEWAREGCIVQVTANSFTGRWGDKAQKVANWLLERQAVHVVASDAHSVESRPPILSGARKVIAKSSGAEIAQALVEDNPRAIVSGLDLPYFPEPEV